MVDKSKIDESGRVDESIFDDFGGQTLCVPLSRRRRLSDCERAEMSQQRKKEEREKEFNRVDICFDVLPI